MISIKSDLGKFALRLTCGGLLLLHGSHSAIHGIQHIKDMLRNSGLPEFLSYGNLVGEVVAPILMIIGFRTRIAAILIMINMALSVLIAHRDIIFARNNFGGWMIELNVFYFMTAFVVSLLGAGRFAISNSNTFD